MSVFQGLSSGHDDHPVGAEDSIDPVSDGEDGAVVQGRPQHFLDETVGFEVDVGRRFVDADDLESMLKRFIVDKHLLILAFHQSKQNFLQICF